MAKRVNYFEAALVAPEAVTPVMVCFSAEYLPHVVGAIETRKARSFWASEDDWIRGSQELAFIQQRLAMDCAAGIINNIIALRGIDPAAARDSTYGVPVDPPEGTTIRELWLRAGDQLASQNDIGDETVAILQQIRDTAQEGLLDGEGAGVLLQLLALL